MRRIDKIIIHCSATPEGRDVKMEAIRDCHVRVNHWSDIGYHYVIELDGFIAKGRDEETIGAHCQGHNLGSIGVCYIGGVAKDGKTPKDTRTSAQKQSLIKLLKSLKARYPSAIIYGHRDLSPDKNSNGVIEQSEWLKACPSFNAKDEYKDI